MKRISNGTSNVNELDNYMINELNTYSTGHYRMYFTSNHDENSWYGTVFEQFGNAAEVFAVLTATMYSMYSIYGGQEAGLNKRLLFFDKDEIIWQQHPFTDLYSILFNLKKENLALWNGSNGGLFQRVNTTNIKEIFAFVREKENDKIFAVFNLASGFNGATLLNTLFHDTYTDVFTNDTITFDQTRNVTLPSWGYNVYKLESLVTGVKGSFEPSIDFVLDQNYPNPFNPSTTIKYTVSQQSNVRLNNFNINGELIKELIKEEMNSGNYTVI